MKVRGSLVLLMTVCLSLLLTGCFKGEQSLNEIDPPQNAKAVDKTQQSKKTDQNNKKNSDANKAKGKESSETTARKLYLLDSNEMVVPQTVELPVTEGVAKQALEYLVKGGPVTSILPNGFQAVLPEGTEILGVQKKGDTMIVDVSKEFKQYEAKDELKILEAMTHTMTQFDKIKRVKLWVNGYPQDKMPVNGTPIGKGYSAANGINLTETEAVDLLDSRAVTMYYPAEYNKTRYYVPMTSHVELKDGENIYQEVVKSLINGPDYRSNALQVFNAGTKLIEKPSLDDGVLHLTFNKDILANKDKGVIEDEVIETIVRTMSAQKDVKAVDLKVEDTAKLVNEQGDEYNEPVSIDHYTKSKKL